MCSIDCGFVFKHIVAHLITPAQDQSVELHFIIHTICLAISGKHWLKCTSSNIWYIVCDTTLDYPITKLLSLRFVITSISRTFVIIGLDYYCTHKWSRCVCVQVSRIEIAIGHVSDYFRTLSEFYDILNLGILDWNQLFGSEDRALDLFLAAFDPKSPDPKCRAVLIVPGKCPKNPNCDL